MKVSPVTNGIAVGARNIGRTTKAEKPTGKKRAGGLKPGQRHAGQFKKGFDPKRASITPQSLGVTATYNGKTLAQLARDITPEYFHVLREAAVRDDVPWAVRVSASQYLADRGWGRASQTLDVNVNHTGSVSLAETLRLMASVSPELLEKLAGGDVIEGQLVQNPVREHALAQENKG